MENEHELSYETLTRVYLGSYEHYKSVEAEVEYLEPGFELQGAKMDHMEQRMFAQLGYRKKKWGMRMNEGLWVLFIGKGPLEAKVSLQSDLGHMEHLEGIIGYGYCLLISSQWLIFVSADSWTISSIPIGGSISPEGFLLPVLLLVVIIVTVVIVIVILIVLLMLFPLSSKLSVMVIASCTNLLYYLSSVGRSCSYCGLLSTFHDAAVLLELSEMPSLISCWMAAKVMAGVSDIDVLLGGILST
ncbi:hypothetical protein Tco_1483706 [Tanacetum coccineum]